MKLTKMVALLLMLAMVLTVAFGCSSNETTEAEDTSSDTAVSTTDSEEAETEAEEELEPVTITSMAPLFSEFDPTDTQVQQKLMEILSEKLNREITLDITYYGWATEFREKLNLAINSGDLPDLVPVNSLSGADGTFQSTASLLNSYGDEGLFVNFMDYDMPNYTSLMESCGDLIDYMYDEDGDCYFMPMFSINPYGTVSADRGIIIDKTVFDENGIAYPTTLDELYEAALQLKEIYPDSYPIIPNENGSSGMLGAFDRIFATRNEGQKGFDGTEYVIEGLTDAYKAELQYVKDLYDNELIPMDYSAWDNDMIDAAQVSGDTYIWFESEYNVTGMSEIEEATGHEYLYISYALAVNDEGWWVMRGASTEISANTWGALAVSALSENADVCMELMDAYMSDEVIELLTWGIEDVSYTVNDDGTLTMFDEYLNAGGTTVEENPQMALGIQWNGVVMSGLFPVYSVTNRSGVSDESTFLNYLLPDGTVVSENPTAFASEYWEYGIMEPENCVDVSLPSLTADETEEFSELTAALFTYILECQPKFIEGEMSLDEEWDDYLEQCSALCDVEAALEIYNSKLADDYYNDFDGEWNNGVE